MARLVLDHLESIDRIQDKIVEDAENILPSIDIDALIKNPKDYLLKVSLEFLNAHTEDIKQGERQGRKYAKGIMKDIG